MKKQLNEPTAATTSALVEGFQRPNRRHFLAGLSGFAAMAAASGTLRLSAETPAVVNLAPVATIRSSNFASQKAFTALNDNLTPVSSFDRSQPIFSFIDPRPGEASPWVEYAFNQSVLVDRTEIYWAIEQQPADAIPGSIGPGLQMPTAYRILYWNGSAFVPVEKPVGLGVESNRFNATSFTPVKTTKIRLQVTPIKDRPAAIIEWRLFHAGPEPQLEPHVVAGVDRSVILGGRTFLAAKVTWLDQSPANSIRWSKISGPGEVTFDAPTKLNTTARFSAAGDYTLLLAASGTEDRSHRIQVRVIPEPPAERLDVVYTTRYSIDNPFWQSRAKALIVNWIPFCVAQCERTDIAPMRGDGGIDNFIESAKANRGEAHARHKGYVFSNAWVHQTVESICIALMLDPQGDAEIIAAQKQMRATLERWIPIITAAQMDDGYLQTAYILADRKSWPERWSPDHRGNHEGYVSGYFIESAINHHTLTGGSDLRLYNAAKKLADCWVRNIGPGKKEWFDGHQEMEQALVRFGRFVNDVEGNHRGDSYIALARFLLESRRGGDEYDQSHVPPIEQYEAVGHAVRSVYFYSGMADIAAETHDRDYESATVSLWDSIVNRKLYLTGGIGSGETSEGFGPDYSLTNDAYCETCSSCGLVFFQYKLNLAYRDARFADLYEQTFYNALLGGYALDGKSFTYTNPLLNTERAKWHVCPCCVGNFPRTLLMIPTWSYARAKDALFVNLYIGGRVNVGSVAGTEVEMHQQTEYPWKGSIALTVTPKNEAKFAIHLRIPDRQTSRLYRSTPEVRGYKSIKLNGVEVHPEIVNGYVAIERTWKAGDRIEVELPMEPQRIVADSRVEADRDRIALQYGPLIFNVEAQDNDGDISRQLSSAPITPRFRPDLLGGILTLEGKWSDGRTMVAIPHYARMNRTGVAPAEYPNDNPPATPVLSKVWI